MIGRYYKLLYITICVAIHRVAVVDFLAVYIYLAVVNADYVAWHTYYSLDKHLGLTLGVLELRFKYDHIASLRLSSKQLI